METRVQLEMAEMPDTDLLICGSCKRSFQLANILGFMKHKKFDCEDPGSLIDPNNKVLLCQACRQKFSTPWSLLKHAQNVHFLRIYLEQNYHVSNVSVEEEPKGVSFSTDNGIFSSSLIDGSKLDTSEQSVSGNEGFNESTDFATNDSSEQSVLTIPQKKVIEKVIKAESEGLCPDFSGCLDTPSSTTSKDGSTISPDGVCCDDQDCGINVMPGTHESLKRCCSAVVPKKRKRHMEIKHRMNFLSRMRRQRNRSNSPASIIIDVTTPEGEQVESKECHPAKDSAPETSFCTTTVNQSQHQLNKTNSVIIQPGSTFSIPLSFARTVEFESEHQPSCSSTTSQLKLPPALQVVSLPQSHLPEDNTRLTSQSHPDVTPTEFGNNTSALEKDTGKTAAPNILQGILAQMFSEKTEIVSGLTSGGMEATVQHEVISLKQEPNASGQCSSSNKSQASMGRNLNGKKRRYPTSRPYKCDQCNDAFNQRIHLKKHQSKHTGIKPFKCDMCDYATVERSHLKVHIRVHTGEKPFKCTYCEYATAQRSTLKIHLKRHHSTTDHCLHCSRRDHTQCYPNVVPCGTNNNNLVETAAIISPGTSASIQTDKMSPSAGSNDVN